MSTNANGLVTFESAGQPSRSAVRARLVVRALEVRRRLTARPSDLRVRTSTLGTVAALYLATPVALFLGLYLHSLVAIGSALLLAVVVVLRRRWRLQRIGATIRLSPALILALALAATVLAFFGGAAGVVEQTGDWDKHNAMLADLTRQVWPVTYPGIGNPSLMYSIAFYLPAALVGKAFGGSLVVAHVSLMLWTAVGLFVVLVCTAALLPQKVRGLGALLVVLGYAGAEGLGSWLTSGLTSTYPTAWWVGLAQYSSNVTALRWVPQHALSAWLIGVVYVIAWRSGRWSDLRNLALAMLVASLWSPFVMIGAAPLALAVGVRVLVRTRRVDWREALTAVLLGAAASPAAAFVAVPRGGQHLGVATLTVGQILLFLLLMVGLWVATAALSTRWRTALVMPALVLAALPFVTLGQFNDLVMRASLPSLFVVTLLAFDGVLRSLGSARPAGRIAAALLVLAVALGLPTTQTQVDIAVKQAQSGDVSQADWETSLPSYLNRSGSTPGTMVWAQYITCLHGRPVAILGMPECRHDPQSPRAVADDSPR